MQKLTINQIWENLEKISIASLESMGREHLQFSHYTLFGYWDDNDHFYEEVIFKQPLSVKLASYSLGKNLQVNPREYWIEMKYLLQGYSSPESEMSLNPDNMIGEMTLIWDANFNFLDEIWAIDIHSPFITAKLGTQAD